MQAIVQNGYGAPERVLELEEIDRPRVGDADVLIRVRATSVNTPDWITVAGVPYIVRLSTGLTGLWRPPTPVRGTDVAGVVEAVGANGTELQPGDEVFGSAWDDSLATRGTFAEFAVVPASHVTHKPAGLSFEEAAASVMSGLTALIAMRDVGQVGSGTRVLINGASGGVGTLAVQIAKALGAEVTGVCSTRNLELVRSLGADHVIDYTVENFTESERRYDVVLDNVINHPPSATARVLSPHRHPHSEQYREHRGILRGPAADGEGGRVGAGFDPGPVRLLCGEPRAPRCPRRTPRVGRRQGGHRQGLPTERGGERGRAHARAPRQRPGGNRRVASENWRWAMGMEIESPPFRRHGGTDSLARWTLK